MKNLIDGISSASLSMSLAFLMPFLYSHWEPLMIETSGHFLMAVCVSLALVIVARAACRTFGMLIYVWIKS